MYVVFNFFPFLNTLWLNTPRLQRKTAGNWNPRLFFFSFFYINLMQWLFFYSFYSYKTSFPIFLPNIVELLGNELLIHAYSRLCDPFYIRRTVLGIGDLFLWKLYSTPSSCVIALCNNNKKIWIKVNSSQLRGLINTDSLVK